ncbi:MAG: ribosome silencing factor [Polaromonas sp.]|uniref:ribosome silencing factor n=1 Tax=Polaromonas sp. TaxID=1869339 RepID=UPI00273553B3|nr:ribosome silencing factor [Polaromonas sp.]MDP2817108.1 ribosome silencing factor [Polaromonas sp.]
MTSTPANTTAAKKDVQKLQRAIIDGLEDVKAVDIQVFDTEHITSLFERVIIASGTSNRQTKALAASVRDAVRDAGFSKPRIEGEENGEWIIVDCGAAVAHIMQPTIRQYYHLEELWGDKPVKLKLGAPAPLVKASKSEPEEAPKLAKGRVTGKTTAKSAKASGKVAAKPVAKKAARTDDGTYVGRVGKTNDWTAKRNAAAQAAEPAAKPAAKKTAVKTPIVKIPATKKVTARKTTAKTAAKTAAKKPAARKTTTRSP